MKHSTVYLGQSQANDFSATSDNLRMGVAGNYGSFIYMAALKGEISFEEMNKLQGNFNKVNKGNVQIYRISTESGVVVKFNNKFYQYDLFRDNPH